MTPVQIEHVQSTWAMIKPISDKAAALFYGRLFELEPKYKSLFSGDITEQGTKLMQMLGAFDEFERAMVRERTRAGIQAARAAGKKIGGSQPKLSPEQQATALELVEAGRSQAEVARLFGVHRSTISRLVRVSRAA